MKQPAAMFQALSHPIRLQVLDLLSKNGEMGVQDVHKHTEVTQSCLSQHLSVLRKVGLVSPRRASQRIFYSVKKQGVEEAQGYLEAFKV